MEKSDQPTFDVVVAGSGNSGLCAAASAAAAGARVLVLEASSCDRMGGSSRRASSLFRTAYADLDDLRSFLREVPRRPDVGVYPVESFVRDAVRISSGALDREAVQVCAEQSLETVRWMAGLGVPFIFANPMKLSGHLYPGETVWVEGRGEILVESMAKACRELGVTFSFEARVEDVTGDESEIRVRYRTSDGHSTVIARSVVLACGGFQANADLRAAHLGEQWREVKVRSVRHNTGELIAPLQRLGAAFGGGRSACYSTLVDHEGPEYGDDEEPLATRHNYRHGIMVNIHGERFVDEGQAFKTFSDEPVTQAVLAQPRSRAYQIFDARVEPMLDNRYGFGSRLGAKSLRDLAAQLDIDRDRFVETVGEFNASCPGDDADYSQLDGLSTAGLPVPKSNWAQPLTEPPFVACPVAPGIVFTYDGLRTDTSGRVLGHDGIPIRGIFAAGEARSWPLVQGYLPGTSLITGAVFGRAAGASAAQEGRG